MEQMKTRLTAGLVILFFSAAFASVSVCEKFSADSVNGKGPLPYNYRIIDEHIHAGGHPLNPNGFKNSDEEVLAILNYLKSKQVDLVIDLENTKGIQKRYAMLLDRAGMKRLHIPMSDAKVPTEKEWQEVKEALKHPVYIHCKWGADRTGAVIARYLMEEHGYTSVEALKAVVSGGSHAGRLGGLKDKTVYVKTIGF